MMQTMLRDSSKSSLIDVNVVLYPTGRIVQLFDEGVQPPKAAPLRDFSCYFYSAHRAQIPACTRVCMRFCTRVCRPFAHGVRRAGVCIQSEVDGAFSMTTLLTQL